MSVFSKKQSLNKDIEKERVVFLWLAKVKMDTSIEAHERVLFSIYMNLTGESTCSRTGQHWIDVGFQNEDPQTDIRGSGMLGLMQMLYFSEKYNELASRYVVHSQMPDHLFPFIIKWFEFTTLTMKLIRSGKLNKIFNDNNNMNIISNELYSASVWLFMSKYIQSHGNIRHVNEISVKVEEYVTKEPKKMLHQFSTYIKSLQENDDQFNQKQKEFTTFERPKVNDSDNEDDDDEDYHQPGANRLNKYAM